MCFRNYERKLHIKAIDIEEVENDSKKLKEVARDLHEECKSTGFFMLKMPDCVAEQAQGVIDAAWEFFQLPYEEKKALKCSPSSQFKFNGFSIKGTGSGYRGFSEDPNFKSDTRESFNMGPDVELSLLDIPTYMGSGVTNWPDEKILPGWKQIMQNYIDGILSSVGPTLCRLFAVALGLNPDFFESSGYFDRATWLLGLTHYIAIKSDESAGVYGIRPHCDSGIFTLLLSDGKPGLQVCLDKSASVKERVWLDVEPPPPGYFIINLGQVLERWSGGIYKATMHRVMLEGNSERISIPFFYEPNIDLVLQPIVADQNEDRIDRCVPISPGQLLLDRLELLDEAFE